uniref:Uncharacterized protein n=1 Tax=Arundo donax TaxID=35708 RepID=A0A0A9A5U7_ARUDO
MDAATRRQGRKPVGPMRDGGGARRRVRCETTAGRGGALECDAVGKTHYGGSVRRWAQRVETHAGTRPYPPDGLSNGREPQG